MTIRIVTDSTCDLPQVLIEELDISVVPMFINIGDRGYLDGLEITRKEFYTNLPDYPEHPTTGTPGTNSFHQVFEDLAETGASQILSIHISESLSATVQVARMAASEYSRVPVTVRDGGQLSIGTGFQVEMAARMARAGASMEAILIALEDLAARTFVSAALDTLEFLRRSGRMNRFLHGIGSLLKLKPILTMRNGKPGSERVRTFGKAQERLIEMVRENLPIERFTLLHTNASEKAEEFVDRIRHLLPEDEIFSMDITPVIGAHIGPGAVGFAVVSKSS
jgi:DegV family protein with EDD domain